jgi:ribosomal protein L34E
MADYETIWKFKCGLCGRKEEGDHTLRENWAELRYGKTQTYNGRSHSIDLCSECLNKVLKL